MAGSSQSQPKASSSTEDAAAGLVGMSAVQVQQILDILNPKNRQLHGPADEEGDWYG